MKVSLFFFVGGFRKTLEAAGFDDGLPQGDGGVGDLHLDVPVHVAQVVEDAVHVQLARSEQDVFPRFFHPRLDHRVGFADAAQSLDHLRQLGRIQGFQGELHGGFSTRKGEFQRRKDVHGVFFFFVLVVEGRSFVAVGLVAVGGVLADDRCRLGNRCVHTRQQDPVSGGRQRNLRSVPPPRDRDRFDGCYRRVLVVLVRDKALSQHPHPLPRFAGPGIDPGKGVEGPAVAAAIELGDVHDEFFGLGRLAAYHVFHKGCVEGSRVTPRDLPPGGSGRGRHVLDDHVHETARGGF